MKKNISTAIEYCVVPPKFDNTYAILSRTFSEITWSFLLEGIETEEEAETLVKDLRLTEIERIKKAKRAASQAHSRRNAKERDLAMEGLGLIKVKGAVSGNTYWE